MVTGGRGAGNGCLKHQSGRSIVMIMSRVLAPSLPAATRPEVRGHGDGRAETWLGRPPRPLGPEQQLPSASTEEPL